MLARESPSSIIARTPDFLTYFLTSAGGVTGSASVSVPLVSPLLSPDPVSEVGAAAVVSELPGAVVPVPGVSSGVVSPPTTYSVSSMTPMIGSHMTC